MAKLANIKQFLDQKSIVVAGVSREGKNIGNSIFTEFKKKDQLIYQINPNADEINGEKCYRTFAELPEGITGAVLTVQPENSLGVVREAFSYGIKNLWMQLGSQSDEAIKFCEENQINYIADECIFMFAEPVESIHKFHRWFWKLIGKYPND